MKNFMEAALEEAKKARDKGEIPVGAVIVKDNQIIGRGHNLTESSKDPTAHAEIIALRKAAKKLGGWRLSGCHAYVTLEPCSMCAGALVLARIDKLFIGAMDIKGGGCGSVFNIGCSDSLNHKIDIEINVLEQECSKILKDFFKQLRKKKSEEIQI